MENTEISVDFRPGIEGFEFADLFKPERLKDLADAFDQELAEAILSFFPAGTPIAAIHRRSTRLLKFRHCSLGFPVM